MFIKIKNRFICPCCGYPTLELKSSYDICNLCNWEDDGQDDYNADSVLGGPNGDYSLAEARENYKKYLSMYSPGRDMRCTGGDTEEDLKIKRELMPLYDQVLSEDDDKKICSLEKQIQVLEKNQRKILSKKLKKYEKKIMQERNSED